MSRRQPHSRRPASRKLPIRQLASVSNPRLLVLGVAFPGTDGVYVHGDAQSLVLAADQDAADGADVAVVAAPADGDVSQRRATVVRGVHFQPPQARAEEPA